LEDKEEIRRLLTEYGATLDGRDAAGFAALFAREGEWTSPPAYRAQGRQAIQAMIERLFANGPAEGQSHILTNFRIDVDGDSGVAASRFYVVSATSEGAPRIRLSGRYDDRLVREDGRWRFASRALSPELRLPPEVPPASEAFPRIRRVVTAHDKAGRSIVSIDAPAIRNDTGARGMGIHDIWESDSVPVTIEADEPDPTDIPLHFGIPKTGVRVRIADMPPTPAGTEPFMHRTEAIDYVFVLEGEITMLLDDERRSVVLRRGDCLVQRGTNHAWVNRSGRPCRILFVIVAARLSEALERVVGPVPQWDASGGGVR
jgi:uncharacterized protein (TIGR02246 family)